MLIIIATQAVSLKVTNLATLGTGIEYLSILLHFFHYFHSGHSLCHHRQPNHTFRKMISCLKGQVIFDVALQILREMREHEI